MEMQRNDVSEKSVIKIECDNQDSFEFISDDMLGISYNQILNEAAKLLNIDVDDVVAYEVSSEIYTKAIKNLLSAENVSFKAYFFTEDYIYNNESNKLSVFVDNFNAHGYDTDILFNA